jgi:anti-sigma regulatory factor (Ser/Thr protein kinase)
MRSMLNRQLPPDPTAPHLARRALQDLPARLRPLLPRLELLVSELVSNSVTHAELQSSDHIELDVQDGGAFLRVEVLDPGRCYDDAQAGWSRTREDDDRVDPGAPHGYGVRIVNATAERAGIHWNMGTVAWFEFAVDPVA